jgi:hypothetical protein
MVKGRYDLNKMYHVDTWHTFCHKLQHNQDLMKKISYLLLLPVSLWVSCQPDKQQIPASVTAITPKGAQVVGYKTCFKATTTGAAAFLWEFGDGTRSSQPEPCHIYSVAGTFTVRLTLNNDASVSLMKSVLINTAPPAMEMSGGALNWHLRVHNDLSSGSTTPGISKPDTVLSVSFPDPVTALVEGKVLNYSLYGLQNDSVRTFYMEEDNAHGHSNAHMITYRHHAAGDTILYQVREGMSAGGTYVYAYETP